MLRIINFTIFTIFFIIAGALTYLYQVNTTRVIPLPFKIANDVYSADEIAQSADILIIGDDFGKKFSPYIETLVENTSKNLQRPLSIYNLATDNEGIHRTIEKIKSLEKLPPIVIYMGGTSEFYEDLYPKRLNKSLLNLQIFQNDYVQTAVMIYPTLSRFLYSPEKIKLLSKEIKKRENKNDIWFQRVAKSTFYFYELQLQELVEVINDKNSFPIFVRPPINYERKVNKICDNAVTDEITIEQNEISNLIEKGNIKEAYNKLIILNDLSVANAQTKYLLGKTLLSSGKIQESKKNYRLAKALDCDPTGAHPVINALISKIAKNQSVDLIDFDSLINQDFGRDILFLTDHSPQVIYWEKFVNTLTLKVKEALKL